MEIKGIRDAILISLGGQEWQESKLALIEKISEKQAFFQGAQVVLDVGNRILSATDLEEVRGNLSSQGVLLSGVLSSSMVTRNAANHLGMITKLEIPQPKPEYQAKQLDTVISGEAALFVQRTMCSGFKIVYQGHIVVIGDVNPGAEIIASGSVVVWGRLQGFVHAGAEGDQEAVVCALDLFPQQLRIASKIAVTLQNQELPKPAVARIVGDEIVAISWQIYQGDE